MNGVNGTTSFHLTEEDKEKGNFKNFNLSKKLVKKLKARNVEYLYPVQTESYSSISEQNDCVIQSATGTGKTLAFVLPLVELLQSDKSVELTEGRAPRVLVVAPTKDIAKQISEDFQSVVNDLSVATIFSAKKKGDDQETAVANGCDVLVATPDRLREFIDNDKVDLSQVKHVVLDEVDRTVDSEVSDELKKLLKNVVGTDEESKAQLIVFSETFPDSVRKLTKKYLKADFATVTVAQGKSEEAAADNDNDEEDDEDEGFVIKTPGKKSGEKPTGSQSVLGKQENYTTYQLTVTDEIKGVGFVFAMLRKVFGDDFDAKGTVSQIAFTPDFKSAVFDLPSEHDEQMQNTWKDSGRIQMGPITELPELDQASMNDSKSFSRGNNSSQRGGGGGGGNRNSGRSNACFNCQKEGHKSWECPEANNGQSQRNGGNKSGGGGGGGCFNCGKDGHKSFECSEPKKAGGRGGAGGERSNACFNCGQEGHRSFECTEPKKAGGRGGGAGGRSSACFNCGQEGHRSAECTEPKKAGGREQSNSCFNCGKDGHKSFECPEPKKGRPSFGSGGGRGGGRGGARGGAGGGGFKRTFGGHSENGAGGGEATSKKIKFDDDDE